MLISIVFSFRNEEKNLEELIERVTNSLSELKDLNYEIIFVNDDSNDGSLDILDLVILSNLILDNEFSLVGDLNSDGSLDILDIVLLVNVILS